MANHEAGPTRRRAWLRPSTILSAIALALIAGFVLFRVNQERRLEAMREAIREAGYPASPQELAAWYAYPEGENAASYYLSATQHINASPAARYDVPIMGRVDAPHRSEPFPPEMLEASLECLAANQETLDLLEVAASIPECRYPIDLSLGYDAPLDHLVPLRQGARLLALQAVVSAETGDPADAAKALTETFAVARSLENEPVLVSQLVRLSILNTGVEWLERVLGRCELNNDQLRALDDVLAYAIERPGLIRGIARQRSFFMDSLYHQIDQIDPDTGEPWSAGEFGLVYAPTGLLTSDISFGLRWYDRVLDVLQLPPVERHQASQLLKADADSIPRVHVMSYLTLPTISRTVDADVRTFAWLTLARTGLAVERFRVASGALPDSLDQLVPTFLDSVPIDPYDGAPLRYKRLPGGYVVYSIALNETDDGGADMHEQKDAWRTGDLTFIVQRSTSE